MPSLPCLPSLALALLIAAPVGWGQVPRPDRAAARPAPRTQIVLLWGGGPARDWEGTLTLADPERPTQGSIRWLWMMDAEPGDRVRAGEGVPEIDQRVPPGLHDAGAPEAGDRPPPAPGELSIEGRTGSSAGIGTGLGTGSSQALDSDGLCLEWAGPTSARLRLTLGDAALDVSLAELLATPIVLPADERGNVLVAKAFDLAGVARRAETHDGQPVRRAVLHAHTSASTSHALLQTTLASLVPFAHHLWTTDHNLLTPRRILAGDFESEPAVSRFWTRTAARVGDARPEATGGRIPNDDPGDPGGHVYALQGAAAPGQLAVVMAQHPEGGVGELHLPLWLDPRLAFRWRPPEAPAAAAFVEVEFNSGQRLRYLSGPLPSRPGPVARDPRTTVKVLESEPGVWSAVDRDLLADALEIRPGASGDGLRLVRFGLVTAEEELSQARFDDLRVEVPELATLLQRLSRGYRREPRLSIQLGMEQSAWSAGDRFGPLQPHLTFLLPGRGEGVLRPQTRPPGIEGRRRAGQRVHAAGGVVGAHHLHLHGPYRTLAEHPELDVDLFELGGAWLSMPGYPTALDRRDREAHGYPVEPLDELHPLLSRWDRLTARGQLLTAYGAPDLHERFEQPSEGFFNRWLTDVLGGTEGPASLLRQLRAGRAVASDWHSRARLSLHIAGRPAVGMGSVLVTNRDELRVEARLSGLLPGSRVRWVQGGLLRDVAPAERGDPPPVTTRTSALLAGPEAVEHLTLDIRDSVFLRAEVLGPAGQIVACGNPLVVLPDWPAEAPVRRLAWDWQGFSLLASHGLEWTHVGPTAPDTTLVRAARDHEPTDTGERPPAPAGFALRARVVDAPGSLVLQLPGAPKGELAGGTWDPATQQLSWAALPAGPFAARLEFDPALATPIGPALLALPQLKRVHFSHDIGEPFQDSAHLDRRLPSGGFGRPGIIGDRRFRRFAGREVRLRDIPLPADEPCWLRIETRVLTQSAGEVFLDDEAVGRFGPYETPTIALPVQAEEGLHGLRIVLDAEPNRLLVTPEVEFIRILAGDGVLDL